MEVLTKKERLKGEGSQNGAKNTTETSETGVLGIPQNTPYDGTKAFNIAFTKGLAAEQAAFGVRCNIVGPRSDRYSLDT